MNKQKTIIQMLKEKAKTMDEEGDFTLMKPKIKHGLNRFVSACGKSLVFYALEEKNLSLRIMKVFNSLP